MKNTLLLFALVVAGGSAYWAFFHPKNAFSAPGTHLATAPVQAPLASPPIHQQGYTISTVASYEVDARILSSHSYLQDPAAALSPIDLALGWGPMAKPDALSHLSFSQADRKYTWHALSLPFSAADITRYTANTHIIPATPQVRAVISNAQPGQLISLRGRLVTAAKSDGSQDTSSLARTGPVFYVEAVDPISVDSAATTAGQLLGSLTYSQTSTNSPANPYTASHNNYASTTYSSTVHNVVVINEPWPAQQSLVHSQSAAPPPAVSRPSTSASYAPKSAPAASHPVVPKQAPVQQRSLSTSP